MLLRQGASEAGGGYPRDYPSAFFSPGACTIDPQATRKPLGTSSAQAASRGRATKAPYWMQKVEYVDQGYTVDIFMIDSNIEDADEDVTLSPTWAYVQHSSMLHDSSMLVLARTARLSAHSRSVPKALTQEFQPRAQHLRCCAQPSRLYVLQGRRAFQTPGARSFFDGLPPFP